MTSCRIQVSGIKSSVPWAPGPCSLLQIRGREEPAEVSVLGACAAELYMDGLCNMQQQLWLYLLCRVTHRARRAGQAMYSKAVVTSSLCSFGPPGALQLQFGATSRRQNCILLHPLADQRRAPLTCTSPNSHRGTMLDKPGQLQKAAGSIHFRPARFGPSIPTACVTQDEQQIPTYKRQVRACRQLPRPAAWQQSQKPLRTQRPGRHECSACRTPSQAGAY